MHENLFNASYFLGFYQLSFAKESTGSVKKYDLNIKVDYQLNKLFVKSKITFLNTSEKGVDTIPFILYKQLTVESIYIDDKIVHFSQERKSLNGFEAMEVNEVLIALNKSVISGDSLVISINYEGELNGYSETGLSYIKDHINEEFTILRPDCIVYPIEGKSTLSTLKSIISKPFDYVVKIRIPNTLYAVNAGKLISNIEDETYSTFIYKNIKPTTQILITIAEYESITSDRIKTFYFEKDSTQAKGVHEILLKTFELYSVWWGKLESEDSFLLIEIPENYGSQATSNYIIQTASAFKDSTQLRQLYHEISHLWNVKSNDEYPTRWDEGLATFLENKTTEVFEGRILLDSEAERLFEYMKGEPKYGKIALINFGRENVTDRSYTVGFLFFYILHELLDEEHFNEILKAFIKKYNTSGATTHEFAKYLVYHSNTNLSLLVNDWIYSTNYFERMLNSGSIKDLSNFYSK